MRGRRHARFGHPDTPRMIGLGARLRRLARASGTAAEEEKVCHKASYWLAVLAD
jgi:hypothetical protein